MATINLLPPTIALKGRDKILITGLRKFVLVGFIIIIASALVLAGYFIYTTVRLRASLSSEELLKTEVASLQETEQSYFLIKDRISKIRGVLAQESANSQITTLMSLPIFGGENRVLEIQLT